MMRKTSSLVTSIHKDNVSSVWPRTCRRGITPPRIEMIDGRKDIKISKFFSCLSFPKPEIKLGLVFLQIRIPSFQIFLT
jgi:hypothetical protein